MEFFDTHCHIHAAQYHNAGDDPSRSLWVKAGKPDPDDIIADANEADVTRLICVGTTLADSQLAVNFVQNRPGCGASIGIHPHEAKDYKDQPRKLEEFAALTDKSRVVAVGECGLDYYYNHSPKSDQQMVLRFQIELALKHNLPLIFHIREAFSDFWPIFDSYKGLKGVVHSFSTSRQILDEVLVRGLYVGLNGIMTFTKNEEQLLAAKAIPLSSLLLETDAPFLTPAPYRGTICLPQHVRVTAEFLARLRNEPLAKLAAVSTENALTLFGIE